MIRPCNWIGGLDLNNESLRSRQEGKPTAVTVLVSLKKKMRVVKIGEEPRALKVSNTETSLPRWPG